ncbi:MAG TPA: hypothetical protein ENK54_09545 [Thiotrichales bacterium]|nr:hypothetical protein [Thiotrichales bacterium]
MGMGAGIVGEVRDVLLGRYPSFVYRARSGGREEVPVFTLHGISPALFESQLRYLSDNGYYSLAADEYLAWLNGEVSIPERSVLLTIDDGLSTVWHSAHPLLARYGQKAVVFLIPGYMREGEGCRPTLEAVWEGGMSAGEFERQMESGDPYLTWQEAREMERAGTADFQSHSLYHHRVFSSGELTGFFRPDRSIAMHDWILPRGYEQYARSGEIADRLGFPLFRSDSLFECGRRFEDDEEIRQAMEARCRALGGHEFIEGERQWQKILRREYETLVASRPRQGRMIEGEEAREEIAHDLSVSRSLISERLGKTVRHLCFPSNAYSVDALLVAKEVGYEACFLGTRRDRRCNAVGMDPFLNVRLKHDYLWSLPGEGRLPLPAILGRKLWRRLTSDSHL